MLDNNVIIKVTNRDKGFVGYKVPELNNLKRNYSPGETKEVTMAELRALCYTQGGKRILKQYLIIHNEEAIAELLSKVEPEYFYTKEDIKTLLAHGTLDQLKDALDFAPEGVVSLIKEIAVETKLNDVSKREAIKEATNFDVTASIAANETDEVQKNEAKERRTTPFETGENNQPQRRAAAPAYKVISRQE